MRIVSFMYNCINFLLLSFLNSVIYWLMRNCRNFIIYRLVHFFILHSKFVRWQLILRLACAIINFSFLISTFLNLNSSIFQAFLESYFTKIFGDWRRFLKIYCLTRIYCHNILGLLMINRRILFLLWSFV